VTGLRKSFGSDNHVGAHPDVLAALAASSGGGVTAYGADELTVRTADRLCAEFGARAACFVFTGSAANVLGLSLLLRPFEAVICAESSHLNADECGAPERILGCKLLQVPTPDGKLTADLIASRLAGRGDEHRPQPRVVQIAQATELGTCYSLAELQELGEFCRANELLIYLDGARLANAAAYLGCSLADLAAHVDVLSFGGTKNGAVGAEALLVKTDELAVGLRFQQKQLLQLASKMRFLAAQFEALLDGQRWLENARNANEMARRLADGVRGVPGVRLAYPVESNGVFAVLARKQVEELQRSWNFHIWAELGDDECVVRWMTAFDTSAADVDGFVAAVRETAVVATGPRAG
jgi:threonine aldolase